jgi:hypothetical protein
LEGDSLTLEQQFELRQLQDALQGYSRAELIDIVLQGHETLLVERQWFRIVMEAAGVETSCHSGEFLPLPETEDEIVEVFGRMPTDEELTAYLNERMQAARIDDVDIEAIALGLED